MKFEYYEIRPFVEHDGAVSSFLGKIQGQMSNGCAVYTPKEAGKEAQAFADKVGSSVFWTIYGRGSEGAEAIGDFKSFDAAYSVLCAILAPMRKAADMLDSASGAANGISEAISILEDICNQSTTEARL